MEPSDDNYCPERCPACDGSGYGTCANCGDGETECACNEPDVQECDQCDGTGSIHPED